MLRGYLHHNYWPQTCSALMNWDWKELVSNFWQCHPPVSLLNSQCVIVGLIHWVYSALPRRTCNSAIHLVNLKTCLTVTRWELWQDAWWLPLFVAKDNNNNDNKNKDAPKGPWITIQTLVTIAITRLGVRVQLIFKIWFIF